eukprot:UN25178
MLYQFSYKMQATLSEGANISLRKLIWNPTKFRSFRISQNAYRK